MKTELTPEEIRMRCAEIEGWKKHKGSMFLCHSPKGDSYLNFPDYCNSIDAINAAVLRLPMQKLKRWLVKLAIIYPIVEGMEKEASMVTASALDRSRAFVAIHEK